MKRLILLKILIANGYQRGLASMVYKFFGRKSEGSGVNMHAKNERLLNLVTQKMIR